MLALPGLAVQDSVREFNVAVETDNPLGAEVGVVADTSSEFSETPPSVFAVIT